MTSRKPRPCATASSCSTGDACSRTAARGSWPAAARRRPAPPLPAGGAAPRALPPVVLRQNPAAISREALGGPDRFPVLAPGGGVHPPAGLLLFRLLYGLLRAAFVTVVAAWLFD